jgi:hypothetical protein
MNWLQRARREIAETSRQTTAKTAVGGLTTVTAVLAEEQRDEFEERAAIMEYDGGLPREDAEREAWTIVAPRGQPLDVAAADVSDEKSRAQGAR